MLCNFLLCSFLESVTPTVAFLPSSGSSPTDTYVVFLSRGGSCGLLPLEVPGLEARLRFCVVIARARDMMWSQIVLCTLLVFHSNVYVSWAWLGGGALRMRIDCAWAWYRRYHVTLIFSPRPLSLQIRVNNG